MSFVHSRWVHSSRLAATSLAALALLTTARADKFVVVRSTTDPEYAAQRARQGTPVESYVFARGQYFDPIPMDSYLARMDFKTIAAVLALDLKKQRYEPAPNLPAADLLLIVHWGVTMANERDAVLLAYDPDPLREASNALEEAYQKMDTPTNNLAEAREQLNGVSDAQSAYRAAGTDAASAQERSAMRGRSNAELLGIQSALDKEDKAPITSWLGDNLRLMMNEERYFIIVSAYDARSLREGKRRWRWTTRMNIRAAGVNFAMALDRLSAAGGAFFGRSQNDLTFEATKDRFNIEPGQFSPGYVKIGELTIVGDSAPPSPEKTTRR